MFKCTQCKKRFPSTPRGLAHLSLHTCFISSNNAEIEYIGEQDKMPLYMETINHRGNVALEDQAANYERSFPQHIPDNGGVHKCFFKKQGLVYAKDKEGFSDYVKEDRMKMALGNCTERKAFYSFQNIFMENDYDNIPQRHSFVKKFRRFSLYNDYEYLHKYVTRVKESLSNNKVTDDNYAGLRNVLTAIIHQLFYIHYYIYRKNVMHGDLHMGNVKIIWDRNDWPAVKAFDFGKSRTQCTRNQKLKDLKYFFNRKAISGCMESFKRNHYRKDSSKKQAKHYPLHRLSMLLLDGKYSKDYVYKRISNYGNALMNLLNNNHIKLNTGNMFRAFSNDYTSFFYEGNYSDRYYVNNSEKSQLRSLNDLCQFGMSTMSYKKTEKTRLFNKMRRHLSYPAQISFPEYCKSLKKVVANAISCRNPVGIMRSSSSKMCLNVVNKNAALKNYIGQYIGVGLKRNLTHDNLKTFSGS
ncbi:MAG: hypothetical protein GY750_18895 [Lentisphaerae bacterium]|nr:hypothetical protein [Lentisphaerota bacterium]MCP4103466.1 hypothetical protein [Lentisphaerota bacterium]